MEKKKRKKKEIYLSPQYEIIIPATLNNIKLTQEERARWKNELANELLVYYKSGVAKPGIAAIYSPKKLRIKRLLWLAGGTTRVRDACNVTRYTISRWLERESIPPKYWGKIAKLLDGRISLGDIATAFLKD